MTPEQLEEIKQRADCAYGTPKLPIEVLRDLYPLVAEVQRLQGQIAAVKEALSRHPKCDRYKDSSGITCGWKRAVHDITYALGGENDE